MTSLAGQAAVGRRGPEGGRHALIVTQDERRRNKIGEVAGRKREPAAMTKSLSSPKPCTYPLLTINSQRRFQMNKLRFAFHVLAVSLLLVAAAPLAQAQATRTWVSGVGDDVNPCSRT